MWNINFKDKCCVTLNENSEFENADLGTVQRRRTPEVGQAVNIEGDRGGRGYVDSIDSVDVPTKTVTATVRWWK